MQAHVKQCRPPKQEPNVVADNPIAQYATVYLNILLHIIKDFVRKEQAHDVIATSPAARPLYYIEDIRWNGVGTNQGLYMEHHYLWNLVNETKKDNLDIPDMQFFMNSRQFKDLMFKAKNLNLIDFDEVGLVTCDPKRSSLPGFPDGCILINDLDDQKTQIVNKQMPYAYKNLILTEKGANFIREHTNELFQSKIENINTGVYYRNWIMNFLLYKYKQILWSTKEINENTFHKARWVKKRLKTLLNYYLQRDSEHPLVRINRAQLKEFAQFLSTRTLFAPQPLQEPYMQANETELAARIDEEMTEAGVNSHFEAFLNTSENQP